MEIFPSVLLCAHLKKSHSCRHGKFFSEFFASLLSYLFRISEEAKSVLGESQSLHLYSFWFFFF